MVTTTFTGLSIGSRSSKVGSCHIVDIHLFFVDTIPFLSGSIGIIIFYARFCLLTVLFTDFLDDSFLHQFLLVLTNFFFFFAFTAFFFLRFLLRTGRLVQCSQVNLTNDIDLRSQFRLTDFKHLIFFRRIFFSRSCHCCSYFCRSFYFTFFCLHRCSFYHLRLFFLYFFHYYFLNFYRFCLHCRFRRYYWLFYRSRCRCRFRCNYFHLFHFRLFLFHFGFNHWFLNDCFFSNGLLYHRLFYYRFYFLFRRFFYFICSPTAEFIQIYFSDRFKLRTCILRYDCLNHIFRLRFLLLLLEALDRYRCLITFLILTFLDETLRFKSKVLVCTKLFNEHSVLLLTNFGIRISLNGIPFLLQELNYRRDSYIQISCNFV